MKKKIIGFTCSCFDLLHAGHILMLKDAKDQCDYLIVGLQTDPTIDRPKTKNKPINFDEQDKFAQTQDLTPVCPFVPFIMMWKTETFLQSMRENGSAFFCGKVGYFPVSRLSSITVKYEEDFRLAEALIQSNLKDPKAIQYYKK